MGSCGRDRLHYQNWNLGGQVRLHEEKRKIFCEYLFKYRNIRIFQMMDRIKLVTIIGEYLFEYKVWIKTYFDICLYLFSRQTYSNTSSCDFFKTNIFRYVCWDRKSYVGHTLCLRQFHFFILKCQNIVKHYLYSYKIVEYHKFSLQILF